VVIVFFNMSRQMGHMSSLCRLRGLTAISVLSVIASCGVRCNSYSDNSHVLLRPTCSADAILIGVDPVDRIVPRCSTVRAQMPPGRARMRTTGFGAASVLPAVKRQWICSRYLHFLHSRGNSDFDQTFREILILMELYTHVGGERGE